MILFLNSPYYHSQLSTESGNLKKIVILFTINCYTWQTKVKYENMSLNKLIDCAVLYFSILHSAVTKKMASYFNFKLVIYFCPVVWIRRFRIRMFLTSPILTWIRHYLYWSGSGSGYGSFHQQEKKVRKTLISTILWLLSLKTGVNVPWYLVSHWRKSRIRIQIRSKSVVRIRRSGSVPKCHRSTTLILPVKSCLERVLRLFMQILCTKSLLEPELLQHSNTL